MLGISADAELNAAAVVNVPQHMGGDLLVYFGGRYVGVAKHP
jgi:hypothetical protein